MNKIHNKADLEARQDSGNNEPETKAIHDATELEKMQKLEEQNVPLKKKETRIEGSH